MPSISTTTRQRRHRTSRYDRPPGWSTTTWRSGSGSPRRRHMRGEVELVQRPDAVGDVSRERPGAACAACPAGPGRARRTTAIGAGQPLLHGRRRAAAPPPGRCVPTAPPGRSRPPAACAGCPRSMTSSSRQRRVSCRRTPDAVEHRVGRLRRGDVDRARRRRCPRVLLRCSAVSPPRAARGRIAASCLRSALQHGEPPVRLGRRGAEGRDDEAAPADRAPPLAHRPPPRRCDGSDAESERPATAATTPA